jgi:hypothetical protein
LPPHSQDIGGTKTRCRLANYYSQNCALRVTQEKSPRWANFAHLLEKGRLKHINNFQLSSEKLQCWYNGIGFPKNLRYFNFK